MKKARKNRLIVQSNPTSPISEQLKTIRASIDFTAVDHKIQTILVSSPEAGSGKSTISANLAVVYAQQDKKTLLIDCDLRRPTIHKMFAVNGSLGLSNLLLDQLDIHSACQLTELDHLYVLTSGVIPPNPNEMIGSKKMCTILGQLKNEFDYIIIDTPPVTLVSDALILSSQTDGVIFVTRYGVSEKEYAKRAIEKFEMTSIPIIGAVLNGVPRSRHGYYYK